METRLTNENQTSITITKELKTKLEEFRDSFKPEQDNITWDELLEFMLDTLKSLEAKEEYDEEIEANNRYS